MPVITRALIRKRAEHNEGIITTLEEITLHQEELESINEVLGATCRKLKILYLQNNIISKIENLVHLKDLEYLNLALNNISKIEGLQNCEFLNKLDLTVNFVDVDTLEESINHLILRDKLRDLYMMGNPAQANWEGFQSYVIAKLPQLKTLDGTEINKSMQIKALQKLPQLEIELRKLAEVKRLEKLQIASEKKNSVTSTDEATISAAPVVEEIEEVNSSHDTTTEIIEYDRDEMTENTPEARVQIYRELAQQKKEKEDRANANAPKQRDYEKEHSEDVQKIRQKEEVLEEREIKQKNEGQWTFRWDEECTKKDHIALEVDVPKYLDSSLIDVDVHPTYISIVIKSKLLRLKLPSEVRASEAKCQRSKVTGSLLITMPLANSRVGSVNFISANDQKLLQQQNQRKSTSTNQQKTKNKDNLPRPPKKLTLQEEMLAAATATATTTSTFPPTPNSDSSLLAKTKDSNSSNITVDFRNIVKKPIENSPDTISSSQNEDRKDLPGIQIL